MCYTLCSKGQTVIIKNPLFQTKKGLVMHKRSFHDKMSVMTPPFQVAKHKMASSMGKAPVMLSAQDLTLLRQYIKSCWRRIAPMADMAEEVFITSSGAALMPSHLNTGLGGSASRIRKSVAGQVSKPILVLISHVSFLFISISKSTNPAGELR